METIRVSNAVKSFKGQKVLNHLDISFSSGKIYGIVGYNGSGKTVLLKCICGFLTLDEGEITILEKKLKKDMDMIQDAGVIIEEPAFLKEYSGKKNLEFLYSVRNRPNPNLIAKILQTVGLDAKSTKKVKHYSLGMKQRLAIAQAIMEDPQLLLLDEPMNGLDRKGVAEIRELLLDLKEHDKTIVLVSHSQEDIRVLCDEIYEIDGGKLVKPNSLPPK
ncbi:MAG: ATP-binding cassette domain-containing protein [Eubacteriales bacterium]|nr:ATP-binding cassette domain-containing protein [Eubacteriales bacterium]